MITSVLGGGSSNRFDCPDRVRGRKGESAKHRNVQNIEMCKTQKCAKHRNVHSAKKHISSLVIPGFYDTSPETGLRRKTAGPQRTRGYDKQKNCPSKNRLGTTEYKGGRKCKNIDMMTIVMF